MPFFLAFTTPLEETVAYFLLETYHFTFLFVAFLGVTVAFSFKVFLYLRVAFFLLSFTFFTRTFFVVEEVEPAVEVVPELLLEVVEAVTVLSLLRSRMPPVLHTLLEPEWCGRTASDAGGG